MSDYFYGLQYLIQVYTNEVLHDEYELMMVYNVVLKLSNEENQ